MRYYDQSVLPENLRRIYDLEVHTEEQFSFELSEDEYVLMSESVSLQNSEYYRLLSNGNATTIGGSSDESTLYNASTLDIALDWKIDPTPFSFLYSRARMRLLRGPYKVTGADTGILVWSHQERNLKYIFTANEGSWWETES